MAHGSAERAPPPGLGTGLPPQEAGAGETGPAAALAGVFLHLQAEGKAPAELQELPSQRLAPKVGLQPPEGLEMALKGRLEMSCFLASEKQQ